MKEKYYGIKGMINNTKVNRHVAAKNFPTALTISLLLILVSNIVNTPIFERAYAIKEFNIDVDIENNEIKRGDTQYLTVTVVNDDTDNRVSDANVKLTVYPPDSDSTSAEDKTDNDGKATFDVKIDDNAETGTYDVDIRVSKDGYDTKTVNTSFDVVKSSGADDEDYNGSSSSSSSSAAASASAASSENSDSDSSAASSASSSNNSDDDGSNSSSSSSAAVGEAAAAAAAASGASSASAAAAGNAAAAAAANGGDASSAASSAVSENGGSSSAAAAAASGAAAAASASSSDDGDSSSSVASSTNEEDN
jgi:5-hydroxyisourate hydrolase-like protein (transthyretin family)